MLKDAIAIFQKGGFILVHDDGDRENEADLMMHASFVLPSSIRFMRENAGGLICFATDNSILRKTNLRFMTEILRDSRNPLLEKLAVRRTPYGDEPAFSISLNHKATRTGITDNDRARTITELSKIISNNNGASRELTENFYAPGHVPLLVARDLKKRKGHTELAAAICKLSKLPPATIMCEMLGEGTALSLKDARKFALKNGIPFIEGKHVFDSLKD